VRPDIVPEIRSGYHRTDAAIVSTEAISYLLNS
jgi:hypothetical protein